MTPRLLGRRAFLATIPAALAAAPLVETVPSARQLRWHELETTAFLHFGVNTFTNKEWGYGDEDPAIFDPAKFDANAIVGALVDAAMRGVVLTCKHHDGFCLWPTATTDHCVRASSDIALEISRAAARAGIGFGVYLSPWDRNSAAYGTPAYIPLYRQQLTELLTKYGEIFEVWFDGANGGDGYYGGAREKRMIDRNTYYDWPTTWALVRRLQPQAVMFSDIGPDVRWVGNERGIAGDPCWATYDPVGANGGPAGIGNVRERESTVGTRHGRQWLPPECDVSIRPGWFWHPSENTRVKTAAQLVDLYYQSVGRGANLLLNVPPNTDGLLSAEDIRALQAFGEYRHLTFDRPTIEGEPFNVIRLREDIRKGQRIDRVVVEAQQSGGWKEVATATSIGARRLIRLPQPVTARRVRARVTESSGHAKISEIATFAERR